MQAGQPEQTLGQPERRSGLLLPGYGPAKVTDFFLIQIVFVFVNSLIRTPLNVYIIIINYNLK